MRVLSALLLSAGVAMADGEAAGAKIALAARGTPREGKFAIYILGGNDHGLWQV